MAIKVRCRDDVDGFGNKQERRKRVGMNEWADLSEQFNRQFVTWRLMGQGHRERPNCRQKLLIANELDHLH